MPEFSEVIPHTNLAHELFTIINKLRPTERRSHMRKKDALMKLSRALRGLIKPSKDNSEHNSPVKRHQLALRKPKYRTSSQISEVRVETVRASEYVVQGNGLRYREVIRSSVHTRRRTVCSRG